MLYEWIFISCLEASKQVVWKVTGTLKGKKECPMHNWVVWRLFYNVLSCVWLCYSPGTSVHGIFQARMLESVAISCSRGSSWMRDQTCVSCIGRWILYHGAIWEAPDPENGWWKQQQRTAYVTHFSGLRNDKLSSKFSNLLLNVAEPCLTITMYKETII